MNSTVCSPCMAARRATSITARTSLTPADNADSASKRRPVACEISDASVVFPVPGGPYRMTEAAPDPSTIRRSGEFGCSRCSCPTTSSSVAGRIRTARGADAPTGPTAPPPARPGSPGTSNRPSDTISAYHVDERYDPIVTTKPVNLTEALESFSDVYSPRIVARVNDYDVRIAHAQGEHLWHAHDDTDEFFLVLDGEFHVAVRD